MQHYALFKSISLDSGGVSTPRRGCCCIFTYDVVDTKIAAVWQRLHVAI